MEEVQQIEVEISEEVGYFPRFFNWLTHSFGSHSTGVRNWLLIAGVALLVIGVLLGPVVGPLLPAAVALGLLISVGIVASISLVAAVVTTIKSALADYADYKIQVERYNRGLSLVPSDRTLFKIITESRPLQNEKPSLRGYLGYLIDKLKKWFNHHPLNAALVGCCLFIFLFMPIMMMATGGLFSVVEILAAGSMLFSATAIIDGLCRGCNYLFEKVVAWCNKQPIDNHEDNRKFSYQVEKPKPTGRAPYPIEFDTVFVVGEKVSEPLKLELASAIPDIKNK